VFRPGHGVASCCLYRDGVLEGTVTDVRGLFMADFTAFIAGRYAGVSIEEQDGGEGRA
jgi:hypothetical protein